MIPDPDPRARLYGLLGTLVAFGPVPDLLEAVRALPALAALHDGDADVLAAGHHAALSLAYASAYLSPDGLVGGGDDLGSRLVRAPTSSVEELDTLLSWLPLQVLAVRSTGETAWIAVVELALELTASHRADLGGPRTPVGPAAPPLDLDAEDTSLRTIAVGLCRPAVSGWMPTGPALSALASAVDLPGGYGDRPGRLAGLLYGAADAGRLPALCGALGGVLLGWADDLDGFERDLEIPTGPWSARLRQTAAAVDRVGRSA